MESVIFQPYPLWLPAEICCWDIPSTVTPTMHMCPVQTSCCYRSCRSKMLLICLTNLCWGCHSAGCSLGWPVDYRQRYWHLDANVPLPWSCSDVANSQGSGPFSTKVVPCFCWTVENSSLQPPGLHFITRFLKQCCLALQMSYLSYKKTAFSL